MPSPTGDASSINYSRVDDTSRRLWQSQIGKANPWDRRSSSDEDDAAEHAPDPEPDAPSDAPDTLIAQSDALQLSREAEPSNPFAVLLHRVASAPR